MILGRVVGKAIATVKHPSLRRMCMLVVEPVQAASLDPVLALDQLGARAGDLVVPSIHPLGGGAVLEEKYHRGRVAVLGFVE